MLAPEKGQRRIVERLYAERNAVHSGCPEPLEDGSLGRSRIGFGGDLDVGGEAEKPVRRLQNVGNQGRRHQARRAAAEKDRYEVAPPTMVVRHMLHFTPVGGCEPGLVDVLRDMRVEIAIRAFGPAERPVNIKRQRRDGGARHGKQAATSLAKASARWPISSFSCGSISPKVRPWPLATKIGS